MPRLPRGHLHPVEGLIRSGRITDDIDRQINWLAYRLGNLGKRLIDKLPAFAVDFWIHGRGGQGGRQTADANLNLMNLFAKNHLPNIDHAGQGKLPG